MEKRWIFRRPFEYFSPNWFRHITNYLPLPAPNILSNAAPDFFLQCILNEGLLHPPWHFHFKFLLHI
jgi:hypothetical protein